MRKNIPFEVGGILRLFSSKALFVFLLALFPKIWLHAQTTVTFPYSGSLQNWTVPTGVTSVTVKLWGAGGGGSDGSGGSGAFLKGTLTVTPGNTLYIIVGGGGKFSNTAVSAGGYGGGGASGGKYGASGGGYSGIFNTSTPSQASALAIAAGGGGGGYYGDSTYGGGGGATTGSNGGNGSNTAYTSGRGGTTSAGGTGGQYNGTDNRNGYTGSALQGAAGNSYSTGYLYYGGGGGGGYFGGGSGFSSGNATQYSSAGGGGSSYINATYLTSTTNTAGTTSSAGAATQAPGSAETGYVSGVGNGGDGFISATTGAGGNGYVTITYTPNTPYVTAGTLGGFGNVCINTTSAANSFTLSGGNLTPSSTVTVGALAGFSYSLSSGGTYTSTLSVPTDASGNISSTVYVKFSPTAVQSYNGNIPISGAGLSSTVNVATTGSGVNTAPTVSANGTAGSILSNGATITGSAISALGCSALSDYGIEYSTTNGFINGNGTKVTGSGFSVSAGGTFSTTLSGILPSTTYYYKAYATNSGGTSYYSSQSSFTTPCAAISSLPWNEGFEGVTTATTVVGTSTGLPSCWNSQSTKWSSTSATTYNTANGGTKYIRYAWSSSNAYVWTPGFQLTAGVSYDFSFWAQGDGYTSWVNDVFVNTSVSTTGATQLTPSYSPSGPGSAAIQSYVQVKRTFVPSASGVYYFAIRGNQSSSTPNYMAFDDFKLEVTPPAITVSPSNPNICAGGSVSLAASSTGSYTYTWSPAAGLSATTGATVTASPTVTTTYTITGTNGGVSNTKTVTVTVNPVPATIGITDTVYPATADACATDYVKLDVTGLVPSIFLKDGFEVVSPNFVVVRDGSTPSSTATLNTTYYSEGVSSARLKGAGGTDGSSGFISLDLKNSIDLTKYSAATLTFDHICAEEAGYDSGILYYSTDGGSSWNLFPAANYLGSGILPYSNIAFDKTSYSSWNTQFTSASSTPGTGPATSLWKSEIIDLTPYIGYSNFKISFSCEYDTDFDYYGWLLDNVKINVTPKITWTPTAGLYTDAGLSSSYITSTHATTLYAAPSGTQSYTANASLGTSACDKTVSKTVTRNKYDFKGTTTDWATASNWFPAVVPDANKCVNIPAGKTVEINSAATAKSITLDAAGQLTIKADHSLTVADALTINNNAAKDNFVIETGGNLLQTSTAANDPAGGHVKVERTVNNIKNNPATTGMSYLFWSSPVSGQITKGTTGFSPGTPSNRFYEYYEATDTFKETENGTFVPGKGYAVRAETSGVTSSTYNKTYKFTGVANNGDISIVLKRTKDSGVNTGSGIGYNLVGNPYPSAIDLTKLFAANSGVIENLAYFWTNNVYTATQLGAGYSNYSSNNYAVFNGLGGNPATSAANGDNTTPDGIVAVGQGFIVQAKNKNTSTTPTAANTLVFKNSYSPGNDLRVATASHFFSKQEETPVNRFWIKLISPAELSNTQLIGYIAGATNGFEEKFDAEDISGGSDLFYSMLGNKQLLIQGRSEVFDVNDIVPVGANFFKDGVYSIALDKGEGIFGSTQKVYLRDKLLNKYHDLTQGAYSFSAAKGNNDTRFEIVYKENTLQSNEAVKSYFDVYKDGISYTVRSSHHLGKVMVYDTSGKLIKMLDVKSHSAKIDLSAAPEGVYIIKAENSGDPKTKKLINTK